MAENTNNVVDTQVEDTTTSTVSTTPDNQEKDSYTKEEVLALLQSEADRRVASALKKQQAKFEKQLSLSKLDGDERAKAEKDNRIAELEEQLAAFRLRRTAAS